MAGMAGTSFDQQTCKALYVGNLHPYVNETMLQEIFSTLGSVAEVKVIKEKVTGLSAGYGFVKFGDHRAAELALHSINGRILYGQEVRVNWAFQKDQREDTSAHVHIFVGDLSSEVNDKLLYEAFSACKGRSDARVMWDHNTGRSKGYGFVAFKTQEDAEAGIAALNGQFVGHRRVRCGWAQHKQETGMVDFATVDKADPLNVNVYVGNVAPEVNDAELKAAFAAFGPVIEVKVYRKGSYGFVQFQKHEDAVQAIVSMNGQIVGSKPLKCAWGRHQARQPAAAPGLALNLMGLQHLGMMGAGGLMGHGMGPLMVPAQLPAAQLAASQTAMGLGARGMTLGLTGPPLGLGAPGHGMLAPAQQIDAASMYYGVPGVYYN